uniref:Uncharacterized protein n=1 Tax=Rhizophora mucronata TaxID=61149 RepID=A0A2P2QUY2_RHIMU
MPKGKWELRGWVMIKS